MISFFKWFARNRRIQVIFFTLVVSLPVIIVVYGIVIPVKNYRPSVAPSSIINNSTDTTSNLHGSLGDNQLVKVKEIIRLEKEKAFQQNRLTLAAKDSIYIVLNLPENLLILEIKGVPVKKVRLQKTEVSNRFALISHENLLPWISQPFILERDLSTIPKAPIVLKQAPKDTIEAAKLSTKPEPPDSTNVYFTLYFDRNLLIEVEQAEPPDEGATEKVKAYRKSKRNEYNRSVFETLKYPRQTNHPMSIKIVISEVEARAIYRAVPTKSHLVLCI
jgi:hypothetical protein